MSHVLAWFGVAHHLGPFEAVILQVRHLAVLAGWSVQTWLSPALTQPHQAPGLGKTGLDQDRDGKDPT